MFQVNIFKIEIGVSNREGTEVMSDNEPSVRIGSRTDRNDIDADEINVLQRRLQHAQNNISFLQGIVYKEKKEFCDSFEFLDQHKATLNELHREIDRLKLQNKDQQWRLVLNGAASPTEVLQETVSCHSLFTTNQNSRNSGQHEVENVRRRK